VCHDRFGRCPNQYYGLLHNLVRSTFLKLYFLLSILYLVADDVSNVLLTLIAVTYPKCRTKNLAVAMYLSLTALFMPTLIPFKS
jgi:hypothetical protein